MFPHTTINKHRNLLHNHSKPKKADGCSRCGQTHSDSSCPAKGNQCHKIGRYGHLQKVSFKCKCILSKNTEWSESIETNNKPVCFQLDTDAKYATIENLWSAWIETRTI